MNRERTCIGCRAKGPKEGFLRIARRKDGAVLADFGGKGPGRGAYVCSAACLDKAASEGSLSRALRTRVAAEVCARLAKEAEGFFRVALAKGSEE